MHGATVHRIDEGVDTGPILAGAALAVDDAQDAFEVRHRLAPLERKLLVDVVRAMATTDREEGLSLPVACPVCSARSAR